MHVGSLPDRTSLNAHGVPAQEGSPFYKGEN